jgi:hypothetical protein
LLRNGDTPEDTQEDTQEDTETTKSVALARRWKASEVTGMNIQALVSCGPPPQQSSPGLEDSAHRNGDMRRARVTASAAGANALIARWDE